MWRGKYRYFLFFSSSEAYTAGDTIHSIWMEISDYFGTVGITYSDILLLFASNEKKHGERKKKSISFFLFPPE